MSGIPLPTLLPAAFCSGAGSNKGALNTLGTVAGGVLSSPSSSPGASLADGFPLPTMTSPLAGGVPPAGADFNAILNYITAFQAYVNAGGQFPFNAALATAIGGYAIGNVVLGNDGKTAYQSLVANNTTDPNATQSTNGAPNWAPYAGLQAGNGLIGTSTGTANALVVATTPAITTYAAGQMIRFVANLANTAGATINAGGGAVSLLRYDGSALQSGDLVAGGTYLAYYNATSNGFVVLQTLPSQLAASATSLVEQTAQAFTTGGTGAAYTLSPTVALSSNAAPARYSVTFALAGSGTAPTLAVSGLTALPLVQYSPLGTLVACTPMAGQVSDVVSTGTQWIVLDALPPAQIQSLAGTVASNALTVGLSPTTLAFRSATLNSGAVSNLGVPTALSLVVPSGATLGTVSGQQSSIAVLALNNAGVVALAVVNLAGGVNLDETTLISSTAISAGATSATTVYSAASLTSVPFRVVGYITSTQATAGTWATAPSLVQGEGGQAMVAMQSLGMGQTWQNVTGSRAFSTTYYNTTSRPIFVYPSWSNTTNNTVTFTINGVTAGNINGYGTAAGGGFIVPPGTSYSVIASQTLTTWFELR